MVKVVCNTNLDLFHEVWPEMLPCLPPIGSYIESKTEHHYPNGYFRLSLKVVSINFVYTSDGYKVYIELHDPHKRSIKEFYEWYAPLVNKNVSFFI